MSAPGPYRSVSRAEIVVDIGDYVVRRSITSEGGGTLTVVNKEGARYSSPQGVIDRLIGSGVALDPLASKERALRAAAGGD